MTPRRHRGWMVLPHATERFVEHVAPVPPEVAHAWLTRHAHTAIPTGHTTARGQALYRLAHPWPGPDAVLVVQRDPDGTRAVVTCGWWDEGNDATLPPSDPAP